MLLIGLSIAMVIMTRDFPPGFRGSGLGPSFFPILVTIVILFLVFLLLLETYKKIDKNQKINFKNLKAPLFLTVIIILYAIIIKFIGFRISTFVFLFVSTTFLKIEIKKALFFSFIITAIVYIIFRVLLKIPLPTGVLS